MMPASKDEEAALAAITTLNNLSKEQEDAQTKILAILHADQSSPHVDIHELFGLYDVLYFRAMLSPRVEVQWSPRLTICAGLCELVKDVEGKYRRIRLKLSEPLLKYRPRSDTINTLLHEAIHAYFFVTTSWKHSRGDDGTGHGTGFLLMADAISNHGDYHITIFHTFHDEVDSYRTHVWKCSGPCQHQAPFFGLVKRSMNRAPSKSDSWWSKHEAECGGTYTKISEPALTKTQINALSAKERAGRQKNKLDSWIKAPILENGSRSPTITKSAEASEVVEVQRLKRRQDQDVADVPSARRLQVACPICDEKVDEVSINNHLDAMHAI